MSTHIIAMQQENKKQAKGKLSDSYRTPPWLFEYLNNEYDFDFDICASDENHLCDKYYTENNTYFGKDWSELGSIGFCNPPFSVGSKEKALAEAYRNLVENKVSSVFIIPADVSNLCWINHIVGKATKIKIISGRVKYHDPISGEESKGALGTAIVEFMLDEEPTFIVNEFIKRDDIKSLSINSGDQVNKESRLASPGLIDSVMIRVKL